GEHNLLNHGISFVYPGDGFNTRFSYEYNQSSNYKPETEFIQRKFYGNIVKGHNGREIDFAFGFMDKDFGASTFYSTKFPRQEEHIQTYFGKFRIKWNDSLFSLYYRRHEDNFLLDRTRPGWNENMHTSYVYGCQFIEEEEISFGNLKWGLDFTYDKITSTKLDKHSRSHSAIFLEWEKFMNNRCVFNLALRKDYYSDWREEFSPNLNIGFLIKPDLKLRSSTAYAFRIPSYTELYYRDSANVGNPDLVPEHAFSWDIGLDKMMENGLYSATFFIRKNRNTIDWIKENYQDPWQANNIGEIFFKGIELDYKFIKPEKEEKTFYLERFGYTYLQSRRKSEISISKYVLDHLQHQFVLAFKNILPFGFTQTWNLNYKERAEGSGWFVLNSRINKNFSSRGFNYELFLEGTNLTDTEYSDIYGVDMPGRWFAAGIKIIF
ncbi:MAG: TonB-dependent receptor plug domain-containing protein, partial [Candidatus Omnitrophota bacterium]